MQLNHTWLPDSLADNRTALHIVKATGSHLILADGRRIYDGISSWWCKPLGHCHELVRDSICAQLMDFEHHIPANAYNDVIEELSRSLTGIFTSMDKVMYASDGSSAVEIAMKLSYESRILNHEPEKSKFIALQSAYHGETIFTLSVCGINSYKLPYSNLLQENHFIDGIPYVNSRNDTLWSDCDFAQDKFDQLFANITKNTTALIIEPIVQGAAGLKIISRDFLSKLVKTAKKYNIHIISDEIMVGLGRLGYYSVNKDILDFEPDFVCFGKNLTAGSIPMSAVVIKNSITDIFRHYQRKFSHSHTHSCNSLAARVAVNYLKLLKNSSLLSDIIKTENDLLIMMQNLAKKFAFISNPRAIGGIGACHLNLNKEYIDKIFTIGIECGIYLRPIGQELYIMPPLYNLSHDLEEISKKLYQVIPQLQAI